MRVLIFDAFGGYDVFTVASVQGDGLRVQHRDNRFTTVYAAGCAHHRGDVSHILPEFVGAACVCVRRLPVEPPDSRQRRGTSVRVLRRSGASGVAARWPSGPAAPLTSYGPTPPSGRHRQPSRRLGSGRELRVPCCRGESRSAGSQTGPPGRRRARWCRYHTRQLTDGPWCPGVANAGGAALSNRYDADMLRVRRVSVTIRVQVAAEALRGTNPTGQTLFVHPGTARDR